MIEQLIEPLTKYARSLCRGKSHIDPRDITNETILKLLQISPDKVNLQYAFTICKHKYYDQLKIPITREFREDHCGNIYDVIDVEEMEERELLLDWAEATIKNSNKRFHKVAYKMNYEAIKKRKYLDKKRNEHYRAAA